MITRDEKDFIQLKFGLTLKRILDENSSLAKDNKSRGLKDHKLIPSLRQLEAATGLRFATIQQIAAGKVNPSCTTIVAIAEALD
ncbi:MAG TPA: helix-turn-helix transcriptional regulator, partial [Chitinophagaceae bacterium]